MTENLKDSGMTAAQARRVVKRAKTPRQISEPRKYRITRDGKEISPEPMSRADIRALCPGLRDGLVTKRLEGGERDIDKLKRAPEKPSTRKRKLQPIPMYSRNNKRRNTWTLQSTPVVLNHCAICNGVCKGHKIS